MTKKRFRKLCWAYFTRLNEWAKSTGRQPMDMAAVYAALDNLAPLGMSRSEWWETLSKGNTFGVGKRP